MDISSAPSAATASMLQVAVQKQQLDAMKLQGASMLQLLDSAAPQRSVNSASQGQFVDALA